MSDCTQARHIDAYHDGELPPALRAEMEAHLGQCPDCAGQLARLRKLSSWMAAMPTPAPSPAAMQRLHRKVDQFFTGGILRLAEALTAVAAAILIVCMIALAKQAPPSSATAAIDPWGDTAATQAADVAPGASDELVASWMVQDLSGSGDHD